MADQPTRVQRSGQDRTTPGPYAGRPPQPAQTRSPPQPVRPRPSADPLPGTAPTGGRTRRSDKYCITLRLAPELEVPPGLTLDSTFASDLRSDLLDTFTGLFDDLVGYVISLEIGADTSSCAVHAHTYLHLEGKLDYEIVRDMISSSFGDCGLDVQFCKSQRNWLKYISKQDFWLLTNIKSSSFSAQYQLYLRAKGNSFSFVREFEHRHCYKFIQGFYEEINQDKSLKYCMITPIDESFYPWVGDTTHKLRLYNGDVRFNPVEFYNFHVGTKWYHKKPHMYLTGPANTGKTFFVETLIRDATDVTLRVEGFKGFEHLEPHHKIIFINDYVYDCNHHSFLCNLLEGKRVMVRRLYQDPRPVEFKGLVIFTSNFDVDSDALRCRLAVFVTKHGIQIPTVRPEIQSILCPAYIEESAEED